MSSSWPFTQWGVDLIGPLPMGKGHNRIEIIFVDYFSKWAEAEPLTTITEQRTTSFIWKNIVCRFGMPHTIIIDNGKQFDNQRFRNFYQKYGIRHNFSSPAHPLENDQVEAINKIIKSALKKKLEELKGGWADYLPEVLWAYRTTLKTSTPQETLYSLTFGTEAVVLVEISIPSRIANYQADENDQSRRAELDSLEEKRGLVNPNG